ncbi:MAG: TVP38/TMEM64 family protein [Acidobacteria bacterium]|nr:TVP38/TMEM64 family protein [Acidobacteriota bacterium]
MRRWIKAAALVALASLAVEAAIAFPIGRHVDQIVEWIRAAGPAGVLAYAGIYVLAAVLMLPGSALTAAAGLAYGPWWGVALVSPVSVAAATLSFVLGRTLARPWVARRIEADPRFRAIDAAVARQGFKIVLLLRLSPVFPFNVLNYALGLTGVRLRHYVLASFLGMLPGTFLYVYLGSLVRDVAGLAAGGDGAGVARHVASAVGFLATVAVTIYIARIARRALDEELSRPAPRVSRPVGEGR